MVPGEEDSGGERGEGAAGGNDADDGRSGGMLLQGSSLGGETELPLSSDRAELASSSSPLLSPSVSLGPKRSRGSGSWFESGDTPSPFSSALPVVVTPLSLPTTATKSTLPLVAESQRPRDSGSSENPSDLDTIALAADSVCDVALADSDAAATRDVVDGPFGTRSSESRLDSASIVESHSFCSGDDDAMPLVFAATLDANASTLGCNVPVAGTAEAAVVAAKPAPNLSRFMRTMPGLRTELAVVQWKWWCGWWWVAAAYSWRSITSPRNVPPPPPVEISRGILWFPPTRPPSLSAAGTSTSDTSKTGPPNVAFLVATASREMIRAIGVGDSLRSAISRSSSTPSPLVEPMWLAMGPSTQLARGFFSIALVIATVVIVLAREDGEARQGLGDRCSSSSVCSTPFVSGVGTLLGLGVVRCGVVWHSRAPKALFVAGSLLPA